jgi:hypothetical protein
MLLKIFKKFKNNKAVSLLEITIAVAIMGVGILPIMALFGRSSRITTNTDYFKTAAYTAENILNGMLNIDEFSSIPASDKELSEAEIKIFYSEYTEIPEIKYFFERELISIDFNYSQYNSLDKKFDLITVPNSLLKILIEAKFHNPLRDVEESIKLEAFKGSF